MTEDEEIRQLELLFEVQEEGGERGEYRTPHLDRCKEHPWDRIVFEDVILRDEVNGVMHYPIPKAVLNDEGEPIIITTYDSTRDQYGRQVKPPNGWTDNSINHTVEVLFDRTLFRRTLVDRRAFIQFSSRDDLIEWSMANYALIDYNYSAPRASNSGDYPVGRIII